MASQTPFIKKSWLFWTLEDWISERQLLVSFDLQSYSENCLQDNISGKKKSFVFLIQDKLVGFFNFETVRCNLQLGRFTLIFFLRKTEAFFHRSQQMAHYKRGQKLFHTSLTRDFLHAPSGLLNTFSDFLVFLAKVIVVQYLVLNNSNENLWQQCIICKMKIGNDKLHILFYATPKQIITN